VTRTEAWWAEYRTPPLWSALYVGEAQWVRTSNDGPSNVDLLDLVKAADPAGKSQLFWAGERLWAVAAVRIPAVMAGEPPRDVIVLLSRSLDLAGLSGAWVLTDGKTALGQHGPEAELKLLLAAVGHEKQGTHAGLGAVAGAIDLAPGLWLWGAEPSPPAPGVGGLTWGLFGGAGLLALVALALGFRATH
jgi:hypothetical protein